MTIPLSLLQRAKEGDAGAIAALMNDTLQSQDVQAKVSLDDRCLQVMLKSAATLNQPTCVAFIQRGLLRLQPELVERVRTFAWRTGEAFPLWVAEFPFDRSPHTPRQVNAIAADSAPISVSLKPSVSKAVEHLQPSEQSVSVPRPATSKPRSELFKLGFVVVLVTMVYFVVAGA